MASRRQIYSAACSSLLVLTALAFGCTPDDGTDTTGVTGGRHLRGGSTSGQASASPTASASASPTAPASASPTASGSPGSASGSSSSSSVSATPTATPNNSTTVSSTVASTAPSAAVATLPPNNQPSPTPTPVGDVASGPFNVLGATSLALLANTVAPWVTEANASAIVQVTNGNLSSPLKTAANPQLVAAVGASDLWVAAQGNSAPELDHFGADQMGNLSEVASYSLPSNPAAIAADGTQAWVAGSDGTVFWVTPASGATGSVKLTITPAAMALDSSNAWVVGGGDLEQITRSPAKVTAGQATTISSPSALAFDASGNLWVVGSGGVQVYNQGVSVKSESLPAGNGTPTCIAYDSRTQDMWIGFTNPNTVAWVPVSNPLGFQSATLPVPPAAISVDALGNVWFVSPGSAEVFSVQGQ